MTSQSELLFGTMSTFLAECLFNYLLSTQKKTIYMLRGGYNRFREVELPCEAV